MSRSDGVLIRGKSQTFVVADCSVLGGDVEQNGAAKSWLATTCEHRSNTNGWARSSTSRRMDRPTHSAETSQGHSGIFCWGRFLRHRRIHRGAPRTCPAPTPLTHFMGRPSRLSRVVYEATSYKTSCGIHAFVGGIRATSPACARSTSVRCCGQRERPSGKSPCNSRPATFLTDETTDHRGRFDDFLKRPRQPENDGFPLMHRATQRSVVGGRAVSVP